MTPEMAATVQAWSAVVQAVGSVLAIVFATMIAKWQHDQNIELVEKERERIEQQDRKRDHAVLGVATRAIAILTEAFKICAKCLLFGLFHSFPQNLWIKLWISSYLTNCFGLLLRVLFKLIIF